MIIKQIKIHPQFPPLNLNPAVYYEKINFLPVLPSLNGDGSASHWRG